MLELETIPTLLHTIWIVLRKYPEINLVRILTLVFKYFGQYDVGTAGAARRLLDVVQGPGVQLCIFLPPIFFILIKDFFMGEILSFKPSVAKVLKMQQKLYFLYLYEWPFQLPICLFVCLFIYLVWYTKAYCTSQAALKYYKRH